MTGPGTSKAGPVFDAVIIGAGHNGQILANYLQKAGLATLVLERRLEPGGGLCTEEVTLPGFYHNLHSFFLRWVPDLPWYKDLQMENLGVHMIQPRVQTVMPLRDGRGLVFYTDADQTVRNIARISERDAQAYRTLLSRFELISRQIITPESYSPPIPAEEKKALLEKSSLGREYLSLCDQTPSELAREFFASDPMRAWLIFLVTTRMFLPDEPGLGYNVAAAITGGVTGSMCRGGSHCLARGTAALLHAQGGRIWEASHVREIMIDAGRATGVVLNDGRRIWARQLVASAIDVPQTFLDLVGEHHLPAEIAAQAKAFKFSKWGLFGVHLALNRPLHYKAADLEPDIDSGLNYNVGLESLDDLDEHLDSIAKGRTPNKPGMQCAQPTLHDPSQAPPGKHTAFLWQFAPYNLSPDGPGAWDRIKTEYMEVCLDRWREYAPNLDSSNILASYIFTPLDVERKLINMRCGDHCVGRASRDQMLENRPFAGLKPYRTPVERLYLCGSGTHPFGNITGAPAYNAAQVICDDLRIKPWWNPPDLRRSWSDLK